MVRTLDAICAANPQTFIQPGRHMAMLTRAPPQCDKDNEGTWFIAKTGCGATVIFFLNTPSDLCLCLSNMSLSFCVCHYNLVSRMRTSALVACLKLGPFGYDEGHSQLTLYNSAI